MERILESIIFKARWLMAPFYLGLALSLVVLLIVFINEFISFFSGGIRFDETSIILLVLTLIDLSFTGNLLIDGAVGANATRTTSIEIENYIKARVPAN